MLLLLEWQRILNFIVFRISANTVAVAGGGVRRLL